MVIGRPQIYCITWAILESEDCSWIGDPPPLYLPSIMMTGYAARLSLEVYKMELTLCGFHTVSKDEFFLKLIFGIQYSLNQDV